MSLNWRDSVKLLLKIALYSVGVGLFVYVGVIAYSGWHPEGQTMTTRHKVEFVPKHFSFVSPVKHTGNVPLIEMQPGQYARNATESMNFIIYHHLFLSSSTELIVFEIQQNRIIQTHYYITSPYYYWYDVLPVGFWSAGTARFEGNEFVINRNYKLGGMSFILTMLYLAFFVFYLYKGWSEINSRMNTLFDGGTTYHR